MVIGIYLAAALTLSSTAQQQEVESPNNLEVSVKYSHMSGVPGANGYTASCGRVCPHAVHQGPRPETVFGTGLTYFLGKHLGIYSDIGISRTVHHAAEESFSRNPEAVSTTSASRRMLMITGGAVMTTAAGFVRPYAYAGMGALNDRYSVSTQIIVFPMIGFPDYRVGAITGGISTTRLNFQFGGGLKVHAGQRHGMQFFGELNNSGFSDGSAVLVTPTGFLFLDTSARKSVGRLGLGYFFQWRS